MNTEQNKAKPQIEEEKLNCGEGPDHQDDPENGNEQQENSEEGLEQIRQMGSLTMESKEKKSSIHCLTIVGQVEDVCGGSRREDTESVYRPENRGGNQGTIR